MSQRVFGLDLHNKYATICGISQPGEVVVKEGHSSPTSAAEILTSGDEVAWRAAARVGRRAAVTDSGP